MTPKQQAQEQARQREIESRYSDIKEAMSNLEEAIGELDYLTPINPDCDLQRLRDLITNFED